MSSPRYVYAIASRESALPKGSSSLMLVMYRDLAAVTRPVLDVGFRATTEAVLQHEAVVEAVRECGPALPVRFGTILRDAAVVESSLIEHYDSLMTDLERLGDKVEVSVTAISPASRGAASPRDARGGSYLRARADELRRDEALQERARALDQILGQLAVDRRASLSPTLGIAVRMMYLLEPRDVGSFRGAFETARSAEDEMRLFLTGPWPPYSFVRTGVTARTTVAQLLTDVWRGAPAELPRRARTTSN